MTRKGDYLTRDFKFELVFSFRDDANLTAKDIMFVGIGEADRSGNEPKNSVYLRVHPPNVDDGSIGLAKQPARSFTGLGKIIGPGPHRVIIEKKEDVVTYMIDIDNDGESDGDSEQTLPDIKEVGPFLHKKNTFLFFGGGGIFQRVRISTPD
jgi:hypothetical protein